MTNTFTRTAGTLSWLLATTAITPVALAQPAPDALPTGGQVMAGQGSISQSGSAMTVQQGSQRMIVDWNTFDVGRDASVHFAQPNSAAAALNRVLSGDASQIYGQVTGQGQIFLVNPNGVVFGRSARVDVGGLAASSLSMSNSDFLNGRTVFQGGGTPSAVVNLGELRARDGGFVALIGGQVENGGTIDAAGGKVALAAGETVRLDISGRDLIGIEVDGAAAQASIDNHGMIAADGGKVWMTARQAGDMISTAINQSGVVRADSISDRNGEIWLDAGPSGETLVSGELLARGEAPGETGGKVVATGEQVVVSGRIDASGAAGGGEVYVGGGWQGQDPAIAEARNAAVTGDGTVAVDATETGDGGTAVVWSRDVSIMDGTISARGAGAEGSGGQVETSSRDALAVRGIVDVSAEGGDGGLWLLDPRNITIVAAGGSDSGVSGGPNFEATGDDATIVATSIESTLNSGGDVTISTGSTGSQAGNIVIDSDISKTGGTESTLTFTATGDITLGAPGVGRKISAVSTVSTTHSSLNVVFQGDGGAVPTTTGQVRLYGEISTNGGDVTFYKPVLLSNAQPIATGVLAPDPGDPAGATPDSGDVTFHETVTLGGTSAVTIDTQSVQDSSQTYLRRGGDVVFHGDIVSSDPSSPRGLVVQTTGAVSIGGTDANYSGAVTFKGAVGTVASPIQSLTVTGPSNIFLDSSEINLRAQSGDTMTLSGNGDYGSHLVLGQDATTISVTGFGAGSADYDQKTFDIIAGDGLSATSSLTINSDQSIKISNHAISGAKLSGGSTALTVNLNPSHKSGANSGAIILTSSTIQTYGGDINLASSSQRAYGVATDTVTEGVRVQASTLNACATPGTCDEAGDGAIFIYGNAPTSASTGGAAVDLLGQTNILAGRGNITIDGQVTSASGSANKDGLLIGNRGQATVTIATTSGTISLTGDASGVGLAATAGASYNGVSISDAAMIRSVSGGITITGSGGGGNNSNVAENYGIKLADDDTQIVSQTGNIMLTGLTGGKTTSYGLYSSGNSIAIGQERNTDTAKTEVSARPFTGNIDLIADTMNFTNSSSSRMRVTGARNGSDLTTGQLNIRSYHDVSIQIDGTEPNPPSPDDPANPTKPLYLESTWFAGSNAIFQEGFGDINIGGYGVADTASTKTLTVAGPTAFRDDLNLLMTGTGGAVAIDAPLSVIGSGDADRVLNIQTDAGVTGTGSSSIIHAASLRLAGDGDVTLSGSNLIGTLAATSASGAIRVSNAQTLTVGTVSGTAKGAAVSTTGVTTTDKAVTLGTSSGNIAVTQDIASGTATTALKAAAGAVTESGTAKVTAAGLIVDAGADSTLTNANVVSTLAGTVTAGLDFVGRDGIVIASLTDGAGVVSNGLSVTNRAMLTASNGTITQSARVAAGSLGLSATNGIDLSNIGAGNAIDTVAGQTTAGGIKLHSASAMTVGTVGGQSGLTTAAGQDIAVAATGGALTLANDVTAGTAGNRGTVRLRSSAGISETGSAAVYADTLNLIAGGTSSLGNANDVAELTGTVGGTGQALTVRTSGGLTIGDDVGTLAADSQPLVGAQTGLTVSGDTTLIAEGGDVTQTSDLSTGGLRVQADAGAVTLDRTTNAVGRFAARLLGLGKSLLLVDKDGIEVTTVDGQDGIASNGGDVTLRAVGTGGADNTLTVSKSIDTGTGGIGLTSGLGDIVQASGTTINGASAVMNAGKAITLEGTTTAGIITLAAADGALSVAGQTTATGALTGTATEGVSVTGTVRSTGGAVSLTSTGGPLAIEGVVRGNSGLELASGGAGTVTGSAVADSGPLTITADSLSSSGSIQSLGGQLTLKTTGGNLTVTDGTVQAATALGLTAVGGDIGLSGGTLSAGTDTVLTASAGKITQSGSNTLTTQGLAVRSSGRAALGNGNTVSTVAAALSGQGAAFSLVNTQALAVGSVDGLDGIATTGGDIGLAVTGTAATADLTLAQVLTTGYTTGGSTGGTVILKTAGGGISGAGTVTAAGLGLSSVEDVTLTGANNVGTLAAKVTAGDLTFVDSDAVRVGAVTSSVPTSTTLAGLDTSAAGGAILLRSTGGAVTLANTVSAGSGVAEIDAAGAVIGSGGHVAANRLAVSAGGDVSLGGTANAVQTVAMTVTGGGVSFLNGSNLVIGDATGPSGTTVTGVTADGDIWVRALGNLDVVQPVVGTSGTQNAVVLSARDAFHNRAGAAGVQALNGRWLIYDDNPTLEERLGGLREDFLRLRTLYQDYTPGQVTESGNGYITTAGLLDPDQFIRQVGGSTIGDGALGNQTVSIAIPASGSAMQGQGRTQATFQGGDLAEAPVTVAAFREPARTGGSVSVETLPATVVNQPITIRATPRQPFRSSLGSLLEGQEVVAVSLSDGAPLPDWLAFDGETGDLIGRLPEDAVEPVTVRLVTRTAGGAESHVDVTIAP